MPLVDFKIDRFLGKGSYGSVYHCWRNVNGVPREFAIKELDVTRMDDREKQDSINEIRILASCFHPNILGFFEAFLERGKLYIVTEYAKGDLQADIRLHKLRGEYYGEDRIWSVLLQILVALRSLHSRHILHRDCKSANIFMFDNGVVKLGDFGISKIVKCTATNGNNNPGYWAQTAIGTPYYLSPQQWAGKKYDDKADVFSLGCLIYEMLELTHPFTGKTMKELANVVIKGRYKPVSSSYSMDLRKVLAAMLQTDAQKRPTVRQILSSDVIKRKANLCPTTLREDILPNMEDHHKKGKKIRQRVQRRKQLNAAEKPGGSRDEKAVSNGSVRQINSAEDRQEELVLDINIQMLNAEEDKAIENDGKDNEYTYSYTYTYEVDNMCDDSNEYSSDTAVGPELIDTINATDLLSNSKINNTKKILKNNFVYGSNGRKIYQTNTVSKENKSLNSLLPKPAYKARAKWEKIAQSYTKQMSMSDSVVVDVKKAENISQERLTGQNYGGNENNSNNAGIFSEKNKSSSDGARIIPQDDTENRAAHNDQQLKPPYSYQGQEMQDGIVRNQQQQRPPQGGDFPPMRNNIYNNNNLNVNAYKYQYGNIGGCGQARYPSPGQQQQQQRYNIPKNQQYQNNYQQLPYNYSNCNRPAVNARYSQLPSLYGGAGDKLPYQNPTRYQQPNQWQKPVQQRYPNYGQKYLPYGAYGNGGGYSSNNNQYSSYGNNNQQRYANH